MWPLLVIDTVVNTIVVNAKSMDGYHYDCCYLRAILSMQSQWLVVIIVIVVI